jgi:hypothetical protein
MRVISDRSSLSLTASLQQVEYDEQLLNADFDKTEGYLRYEAEGARTNLKIDAGYSQLDRDAASGTENGALLRADISRRVSESSTLSLSGAHEFSTAAGAFTNDQGVTTVGLGSAPGRQSADPFTLDRLTLGWGFNRGRTALNLTSSWAQRSYDQNPVLDQTLTTLLARVRRDMSPTISLELSASYTSVTYEPPASDYDDLTAGATFSWRLSRNLTLDVKYDFADRNSDAALTEYTENRLWLTIGFGRGDPRATRAAPTFGVDSMRTGS